MKIKRRRFLVESEANMKRLKVVLLGMIIMVLSVCVPQVCKANASTESWDGTVDISWYKQEEESFLINSGKQLAGLAKLVNEGNDFAGKEIHLAKDIYLNNAPLSTKNVWVPIGKGNDIEDTAHSFQGEFYGDGYYIYNIYVPSTGLGGLFGCIGESGIVCDVVVSQGRCDSGGIIANINKGIIKFCSNNSIVGTTAYDVGGICNTNYNLVYGCENLGEVWGSSAAGIVGKNMEKLSTINQCRNKGKVGSSSVSCGIVVANMGWVYNCYNVGSLSDNFGTLNKARALMGIVDENNNKVLNCYSSCTYDYSEDDCWWVYGISRDETENCFYYSEKTIGSGDAEKVDLEEMKKTSFVQKLLPQTTDYNVVKSWNADEENSNSGLPVTDADIQRKNGTCKCQPEIWMTASVFEKEVGENYVTDIQFYYTETMPNIYFDNEELGWVSYDGDIKGGYIFLAFRKE
ncbi:MAG: hypothetical protein J5988_03235, partial [Eubacterium sp.]|nr:hypothetical protein [Eubacterium sp.]